MLVQGSGNVGIGTSTVDSLLHLQKSDATAYSATATDGQVGVGPTIYLENPANSNATVGGQIVFGMRSTESQARIGATGGANPALVFGTNDAERLRIDSNGNVGIGTSSVAAASSGTNVNIHSPVAQTTYLKLSNSSTGNGTGDGFDLICDTSGGGYVWTRENNHLYFGTSNAERMRIDSSGNVLVGTTNAQYNSIGAPAALTSFNNGSRFGANFGAYTTGSQYAVVFSNPNGQIGGVNLSGTSTSYVTSSDYRLKENITDITDATTRLKQLNPVRFNFIADADTTVDGFLAHEVQDIVPEAIHGTKDAMRDEEYTVSAATGDIYTPAVEATYDEDGVELTAAVDEVIHSADVEQPEELVEGQQWRETTAAVMNTRSVPDYQGIDQSKLVPLLVKTIQELEARITALENV